jgi:hypothetical protein
VWHHDLLLNLLAEVVGIAFTVLLIDRILRYREEQRWRPAKNSLYAKMFKEANDLLQLLLPSDYYNRETYFYSFGQEQIISDIELGEEIKNSKDFGKGEKDREWLYYDTAFQQSLYDRSSTITADSQLAEADALLDDMLETSSALMGPVDTELLLRIRGELQDVVATLKLRPGYEHTEEDHRQEFSFPPTFRLVISVLQLRLWLERHANQRLTNREYFSRLAATPGKWDKDFAWLLRGYENISLAERLWRIPQYLWKYWKLK